MFQELAYRCTVNAKKVWKWWTCVESLEIKAYDLPLPETFGDWHQVDVGTHNDVHKYIWLPVSNFWVRENVLHPLVWPQEVLNQLGLHTLNNSCNRYGASGEIWITLRNKLKTFKVVYEIMMNYLQCIICLTKHATH